MEGETRSGNKFNDTAVAETCQPGPGLATLLSHRPHPEHTRMAEQRIALVTGGNRGIGLEISRQLAGLVSTSW